MLVCPLYLVANTFFVPPPPPVMPPIYTYLVDFGLSLPALLAYDASLIPHPPDNDILRRILNMQQKYFLQQSLCFICVVFLISDTPLSLMGIGRPTTRGRCTNFNIDRSVSETAAGPDERRLRHRGSRWIPRKSQNQMRRSRTPQSQVVPLLVCWLINCGLQECNVIFEVPPPP